MHIRKIKPTETNPQGYWLAEQKIDGKLYLAEGDTFSEAFMGCLLMIKETPMATNMEAINKAANEIKQSKADAIEYSKKCDVFWANARARKEGK